MITLSVIPTRAQFRPGEPITLRLSVRGPAGAELSVQGQVRHGAPVTTDEVVAMFGATLATDAAGEASAIVTVPLPHVDVPARGSRGFAVVARADHAVATTSFDVAEHWSHAPRYGFFSDFAPEEPHELTARNADAMLALHLNVIQFYDWMYSHHTLVPTTDEFVDPLGRTLSLAVVRRKIAAAQERGMAAIGYGALYGAEADFSNQHEDWLLYDGRHDALQLADIFYLQDIREVSPWRRWIIDQFRHAVSEVGFDGIHIDQYGYPKRSLSRVTGVWEEVALAEEFPGFVEQACREIAEEAPSGGSIFNLVNAWPLEDIPVVTADAATYIEVWDPFSTYRDLYDLVRRSRELRPDKHIILAAYLRAFHPVDGRADGAMTTFRLAHAAIGAAGGFHLVAGEGQGLLTEAYYPSYGTLGGDDFEVVRRYMDFEVRNTAALHHGGADVAWTQVGPTNDVVLLDHPELDARAATAYGSGAVRDTVWTIQRDAGSVSTLSLINLLGIESDHWNTPQPTMPTSLAGVRVRAVVTGEVKAVWWDTPDDGVGHARPLEFAMVHSDRNRFVEFTVPHLDVWSVVWWERA